MRCNFGTLALVACLAAVAAMFWTSQASAEWIQVDRLTPSDGSTGDNFGFSIAFDGNRVLVGARKQASLRGAAYLYEPNVAGTDYSEIKKFVPADAAAGDYVGMSVAISGDLAFVAGSTADVTVGETTYTDAGAVWVFDRNQPDSGDPGNPTAWGQIAKIVAATPVAGAGFGSSMALDGDTLLICAQNETYGGETMAGAAYLFDVGTLSQVQRIQPSDFDYKDYFGQSCGIDGDTLAIGAHGGNKGYVFEKVSDTWTETKILTAAGSSYMGTGTTVEGDNVVVGAYKTSVGGLSQAGTSYVFGRDTEDPLDPPKPWGLDDSLEAGDPQKSANFGVSNSIEAARLLVGAQGADSNTGAVYYFTDENKDGDWTPIEKISAGVAGEKFGNRLVMLGDLAAIATSTGEAAYVYAIPEPSTLGLALAGLLALLAMARRNVR